MVLALSLVGCAGVSANKSDTDNAKTMDVNNEAAINDVDSIEESVEIKTIEDTGEKFFEFSSVDMDGNKVTNDIFAEKDLTVVNVYRHVLTAQSVWDLRSPKKKNKVY